MRAEGSVVVVAFRQLPHKCSSFRRALGRHQNVRPSLGSPFGFPSPYPPSILAACFSAPVRSAVSSRARCCFALPCSTRRQPPALPALQPPWWWTASAKEPSPSTAHGNFTLATTPPGPTLTSTTQTGSKSTSAVRGVTRDIGPTRAVPGTGGTSTSTAHQATYKNCPCSCPVPFVPTTST